MTWIKKYGMKINADKCHLLADSKEKVSAKIVSYNIQSCKQQKLLEVLIDNKLTFDKQRLAKK